MVEFVITDEWDKDDLEWLNYRTSALEKIQSSGFQAFWATDPPHAVVRLLLLKG